MDRKKVLIVACGLWQEQWTRELGKRLGLNGDISLLSAMSVREAEDLFAENPGCSAIVLAVYADESPTAGQLVPLAFKFRTMRPRARMVAVGDADDRRLLGRAGCNYGCTRDNLIAKLTEVLHG
ncbi:MAG: hypothetical protein WCF77_02810 [Minisyncoccia bacterium]